MIVLDRLFRLLLQGRRYRADLDGVSLQCVNGPIHLMLPVIDPSSSQCSTRTGTDRGDGVCKA